MKELKHTPSFFFFSKSKNSPGGFFETQISIIFSKEEHVAERKNHKYIDKVRTKTGNIRYVYEDGTQRKQDMLAESGSALLGSVADYVKDGLFNPRKYTQTEDEYYADRRRKVQAITTNGKKFIDDLLTPVK